MKPIVPITLAAALARHTPGGSAERRSFGARLALSSAVFFWKRRART